MRIVIDIEANALHNPDKIWVVVCYDIDTREYHIFRKVTDNEPERTSLVRFLNAADLLIGHNLLGYDAMVLENLLGYKVNPEKCLDTFILSKLIDYSRKKHSIEDYGIEFGKEKGKFSDWAKYSKEMEEYCIRDVDICYLVYTKYKKYIEDSRHKEAINLEHNFAYYVVNSLSNNGFAFNKEKAKVLLSKVTKDLKELDDEILKSFQPRQKFIRTILPKATKFGTISLSNIPKALRGRTSEMEIGVPFNYYTTVDFNPASHKQIITVLNEAGWKPFNKTDTHIECERRISQLRYAKQRTPEVDLEYVACKNKLVRLETEGWKIDEENLETLPASAPASARTLAKRILLESRRRTLVEWLELVQDDGRIHGEFHGIGAWTHRMAHRKPNTANIPNEFSNEGKKKLLGKEFRQLWMAPKNRLLVGVDAEGIQLRIFAHYINDPEFTKALEEGKKEDKSDPHSLNQRILGSVCKTRQQAKRFIFALLLGGGIRKLTAILGCEQVEAEAALERLLDRYQGFAYLKGEVIPKDARRGWFTGLDGRSVAIPSDTVGGRRHLAMSGYLQNGEKIVMARASLEWHHLLRNYDACLVDLVHDEWQVECPNDMKIALEVAKLMSDSLEKVGKDLGLLCKLAGSYWNDDHKDYTIGTNWYQTH